MAFPDGRTVKGTGKGQRQVDAELIAVQMTIDNLRETYPELLVNWDDIYVEAQAGDALIKLGIYLSESLQTASEKSQAL